MSDHKTELLGKLASRTATVGVIGLGYVGLPLALVFEEAGFPVLGFDVDAKKPEALHRGESYIKHIGPERVAAAFARGRISATTDFARLAECDAILICVPTPLGRHREPDISYIEKTAEAIAAVARPGQLVVLESTTYPGTTREEIVPRLEAKGLKCGETVFVAFSPEREDPGNPSFHTRNIPKVVGGIDAPSGDVAEALYAGALEKVVRVSTAEVAETLVGILSAFPMRERGAHLYGTSVATLPSPKSAPSGARRTRRPQTPSSGPSHPTRPLPTTPSDGRRGAAGDGAVGRVA